jgi:hypothetical protein
MVSSFSQTDSYRVWKLRAAVLKLLDWQNPPAQALLLQQQLEGLT